jgi:hypothetical protein
MFNSLLTYPKITAEQRSHLRTHVIALLKFLQGTGIPKAPGWPFKAVVKLACVHEHVPSIIEELAQGKPGALVHNSAWGYYAIPLPKPSGGESQAKSSPVLPEDTAFLA